jgi:nickel-dependent lactate racemase
MCGVRPGRLADIVITTNGGAPLDQNIYQAVKCMTAAESAAAPGAVIVALSECGDGAGGDSFLKLMRDCESPEALLDEIERVPMAKTAQDQWQAQILARIMKKHKVILVCAEEAREAAAQMKLITARCADEAFEAAVSLRREAASGNGEPYRKPTVTIIPDGVSVIVNT